MKTLFQEDLLEAGYELPTSGLCYNLDPEDAKALISEGEWLLAEDELVAREGDQQQFLYMIVSGSVELSKRDDRGKQQSIADLGTGDTFGEVAFLRGHIASATSETRGLCILWRMDHDQLLEFIGSHGPIAGQLCLNLAGLLADRLLKENKLISKVKMDLEEAITHLHTASEEDNLKTTALKELQSKVEGLNRATRIRREKESKRSRFNAISMTSLAIACIAIIAMVGLYHSADEDSAAKLITLEEELSVMKKNESFYLDLKRNLEAENQQLVIDNNQLGSRNTTLSDEILELQKVLSYRDNQYDSIKAKLMKSEEELAVLISLEKEAQSETSLSNANPAELYVPLIPLDFIAKIKDWSQSNSTLAFPCRVSVTGKPVILSDISLSANVEVEVGGEIVVTRFHPVSEDYIVARKGDSDTFMASVHIENTNVLAVLAEKYVAHMKSLGREVANPIILNRFSQVDKNISETD